MNKHKYYDIIVAWASGEKIQYNFYGKGWCDFYFYPQDGIPGFNNENTEWRVKPKTITKCYRMALHSDSHVAAYDVTNSSIDDPAEYNINGFVRWLGDIVEVETEVN